jgi:beta-N-acetylhexosaminidase
MTIKQLIVIMILANLYKQRIIYRYRTVVCLLAPLRILIRLWVLLLFILASLSSILTPIGTAQATAILRAPPQQANMAQVPQEEDALSAQVEAILAQMSPADRVGQLFVIAFQGSDTSFNSDIAELIFGYRVGGVVLSPRRSNFSNAKGTDTARQVAALTNQLQGIAYGVLIPPAEAVTATIDQPWPPVNYISLANETGLTPPNLPLFVAVEQLGDGLYATSLRNSFTPVPSQLALGATWNPELARKVGQIVGRELSAVGVNLLLGPNLDVFDQPRADKVGALSLHSFGGNPYWVSQMGRAYIAGVHEGSMGRIAAISRYFPGQGNIDRLPDQEVATVQQSIQELRQTALMPFRSVTRQTFDDQPHALYSVTWRYYSP